MNLNLTQTVMFVVFFLVWLFDFYRYMELRREVKGSFADEQTYYRRGNRWLAYATIILLGLFLSAYHLSESVIALIVIGLLLLLSEAVLLLWSAALSIGTAADDVSNSAA